MSTCPLCKSEETAEVTDRVDWARCTHCGLFREINPPLGGYNEYKACCGELQDGTWDNGDDKIIRTTKGDIAGWLIPLRDAEATLIDKQPKDILLEIGCGSGDILDFAKSTWKHAEGTEVYAQYVRFTCSRGHTVHYCDLATKKLPHLFGRCNLILANQVIEHAIDPIALVQEVGRYLTPYGIFWATYPVAYPNNWMVRAGEWFYWTPHAIATLAGLARLNIHRMMYTPWSYNVAMCLPIIYE